MFNGVQGKIFWLCAVRLPLLKCIVICNTSRLCKQRTGLECMKLPCVYDLTPCMMVNRYRHTEKNVGLLAASSEAKSERIDVCSDRRRKHMCPRREDVFLQLFVLLIYRTPPYKNAKRVIDPRDDVRVCNITECTANMYYYVIQVVTVATAEIPSFGIVIMEVVFFLNSARIYQIKRRHISKTVACVY
jgi:hypothetical protein